MTHHWPELDYKDWKPTYETLHRWLQIVGKLRLCLSPWVNHSWNSTLYLTARGLSTSAIPVRESTFTVELDFIDHRLICQNSGGMTRGFDLGDMSVAQFYEQFMKAISEFEINPSFSPAPNEVEDATPFYKDGKHCTYNKEHAHKCFQALVRVHNVFQEFRAGFVGKSSPVHFFWGSFDLAVTRFSGRPAPEHPGGVPHLPDVIAKEAYSQEVMSCGFWPGNEMYPEAAFYAYAYPEPEGFAKGKITPAEAFYHKDLHEFVLPYKAVCAAENPHAVVMSFLNSTYRLAADLARWDRSRLEENKFVPEITDQFSSDDKARVQ